MNNDWKDALSSIRDSFDEPKEEKKEEVNINFEEAKPKYLQPGTLYVEIDKKGRNGKVATIIEGFTIQKEEVEEIARNIKQKFGVGGSIREGEILIQGDYKEELKEYLKQNGFKVK